MADIIALGQHQDDKQFTFINADNAMRFWFYCPTNDGVYGSWMQCRVTRLPVVEHDEHADGEDTIPIAFDEDALDLLNNFRERCGLSALVIAELEEAR